MKAPGRADGGGDDPAAAAPHNPDPPAMTDETPPSEARGEAELYLYATILALVRQGCEASDRDSFDSWAISAYERAILALADHGYVELDRGGGRIFARLTEAARSLEDWREAHERRQRIAEARELLATVPGMTPERAARLYAHFGDIAAADLGDEPR